MLVVRFHHAVMRPKGLDGCDGRYGLLSDDSAPGHSLSHPGLDYGGHRQCSHDDDKDQGHRAKGNESELPLHCQGNDKGGNKGR